MQNYASKRIIQLFCYALTNTGLYKALFSVNGEKCFFRLRLYERNDDGFLNNAMKYVPFTLLLRHRTEMQCYSKVKKEEGKDV